MNFEGEGIFWKKKTKKEFLRNRKVLMKTIKKIRIFSRHRRPCQVYGSKFTRTIATSKWINDNARNHQKHYFRLTSKLSIFRWRWCYVNVIIVWYFNNWIANAVVIFCSADVTMSFTKWKTWILTCCRKWPNSSINLLFHWSLKKLAGEFSGGIESSKSLVFPFDLLPGIVWTSSADDFSTHSCQLASIQNVESIQNHVAKVTTINLYENRKLVNNSSKNLLHFHI